MMKKLTLKQITLFFSITALSALIFYNTKDIIFGAPLSLETIHDGETVNENFLPINGKAKHSFEVEINGRQVALSKDGVFSDGVVLSPGYNVIEVKGQDRFGRSKSKTLHLVAIPTPSVASTLEIHYEKN